MLLFKLEENEKLPLIEFSQKFHFQENCLDCERKYTVFFHRTSKKKWLYGKCQCGFITDPEIINYIQPDHVAFDIIYGYNPFKDSAKKQKELDWQKEKRKEELNQKYDKMFSKPWERQAVKDIVLEEKQKIGGL